MNILQYACLLVFSQFIKFLNFNQKKYLYQIKPHFSGVISVRHHGLADGQAGDELVVGQVVRIRVRALLETSENGNMKENLSEKLKL